jgi:hypothetical protein
MKTYASVWLLMVIGACGSIAAAATTPVSFTLNLTDAGQPVPVQFRAWVPMASVKSKGSSLSFGSNSARFGRLLWRSGFGANRGTDIGDFDVDD